MTKRFWVFSLIILALIYAALGIYYYKKSFRAKTAFYDQKAKVPYTQPKLVVLKNIFDDFETINPAKNNSISTEQFSSGKKSFKITPSIEYGAEVIQYFSAIPSLNDLRQIEVVFKIQNVIVEEGTSWVLELNGEDGKVIGWYSEFLPTTLNKWETCVLHFIIKTEFLNNANRIKTYLWNKNKGELFIDDISINFLGLNKEINNTVFNPLYQTSFFFDLENDTLLEMSESLTDDISHSGKRSSFVSGKDEYSVLIRNKLIHIMNDTVRTVGASVWLYPLNDNPECTFVFEVRNSQDEQIYWNGKSTAKMNLIANRWQKINASFNISPDDYRKFGPDDNLCIYVFNNNNSKIYADDFEVSFGEIPEPRGIRNFVDMNVNESNSYQFDRYHPPFRISYLQKENIGNNNSPFLIYSDSIYSGNIKPDHFIATGIFTGLADGKDELLVISDNLIESYYYCNDKNGFIHSGNLLFDKNKFAKCSFLKGNFSGDEKDELIITKGNSSAMFGFSAEKNQKCINNLQGLSMNLIWSGELYNENIKMMAGFFSGNNYEEILFENTDSHFIIKRFNGKVWLTICDDNFPQFISTKPSMQVCGKFTSSIKDVVLFSRIEKNKTHFSFLELVGQNLKIKPVLDQENVRNIFSLGDVLYPIKVKGKKHDDIFAFNNKWRFELKYISIDSKGFYVSSVSDFKGYLLDQNPKYYEFSRFISGRFTENKTQLLCLLFNCSDKTFNGTSCAEYKSISTLPNTIQLYNFSQ